METREYVEYLLKNYTKILKDIEVLKFEYKAFEDIEPIEVIEALNFSSSNYERTTKGNTSDKTCEIALIYNEAAKRMSTESRHEIYKMMKGAEIEMARLNYCIERLEPTARAVVRELFIEKCSWSYVCIKNSISEKTLNKYKKKGINEIIEMFDVRRLAYYSKNSAQNL
jgi:hypothetical protein